MHLTPVESTLARAGTAPVRIHYRLRDFQYGSYLAVPVTINLGVRGLFLKTVGDRFEPVGKRIGAIGQRRIGRGRGGGLGPVVDQGIGEHQRRELDVAKLQKLVKDRGFLIDGGYGKIKGTTFRLSNMGDETEASMQKLYDALDEAMKQL